MKVCWQVNLTIHDDLEKGVANIPYNAKQIQNLLTRLFSEASDRFTFEFNGLHVNWNLSDIPVDLRMDLEKLGIKQ